MRTDAAYACAASHVRRRHVLGTSAVHAKTRHPSKRPRPDEAGARCAAAQRPPCHSTFLSRSTQVLLLSPLSSAARAPGFPRGACTARRAILAALTSSTRRFSSMQCTTSARLLGARLPARQALSQATHSPIRRCATTLATCCTTDRRLQRQRKSDVTRMLAERVGPSGPYRAVNPCDLPLAARAYVQAL